MSDLTYNEVRTDPSHDAELLFWCWADFDDHSVDGIAAYMEWTTERTEAIVDDAESHGLLLVSS